MRAHTKAVCMNSAQCLNENHATRVIGTQCLSEQQRATYDLSQCTQLCNSSCYGRQRTAPLAWLRSVFIAQPCVILTESVGLKFDSELWPSGWRVSDMLTHMLK